MTALRDSADVATFVRHLSDRSPAMLVFELPLPENLGNARMHWAAKHRAKKAYWTTLDVLVMAKRLPKAEAPLGKARALAVVRTYRPMDADNATSRMKWVCDWLQSRGYIVNDEHLELAVSNVAVPLKSVGIHLTLEAA